MKLTVQGPPPVPPRELEEVELVERWGLLFLRLTVLRQAGVRRDGEVRYKRYATEYRVEKTAGAVVLVKDDGAEYRVDEWGCTCPDQEFKGRLRTCKHAEGLRAVGLIAASTSGA